MKYYFNDVERLQFLGLNPNETACVIIYIICALWVFEKNIRNIKLLIPLYVLEIFLLICLAKTISRGGIVSILIVVIMAGVFHAKKLFHIIPNGRAC